MAKAWVVSLCLSRLQPTSREVQGPKSLQAIMDRERQESRGIKEGRKPLGVVICERAVRGFSTNNCTSTDSQNQDSPISLPSRVWRHKPSDGRTHHMYRTLVFTVVMYERAVQEAIQRPRLHLPHRLTLSAPLGTYHLAPHLRGPHHEPPERVCSGSTEFQSLVSCGTDDLIRSSSTAFDFH